MKTLFENSNIVVSINHCDEIFITKKHITNNVMVRISPSSDKLVITADNAEFEPTSVNGLPGFNIKPR